MTTSVLTRRQSGGDATANGICKSAEDSYINVIKEEIICDNKVSSMKKQNKWDGLTDVERILE